MSALLPCPGCASPSSICDRAGKTVFYGECDCCGWRGPRRLSEAEAIAAWNRRAPTDARRAAEEMRERAAKRMDNLADVHRAAASVLVGAGKETSAVIRKTQADTYMLSATAIRALPLPGEGE